MIETDKKGCRELLIRRMTLAVITGVTLQSCLVCCLVPLASPSTSYARWLEETRAAVTSPRMWTYLTVLAAVTALQGLFRGKSYLRPPPYHKSRFARLCATLATRSLLLRALYVAVGGVLVWLRLSLRRDYGSSAADCSIVYGTCLTEEYYFLLFSGLWSGLYFAGEATDSAGGYFRFPVVAQSKFLQTRRRIYATFPTLMVSSAWSTLYYMAVYYFVGSYCREALISTISMQTEVKPLNILSRLLNLPLISQVWLHQFVFISIISNTHILFEIYLTEWMPFKFGSSGAYTPDSSEMTLIDVLAMDKIPIMQHLGYLDLITLAQKERLRRGALFTLSQPGGHPYNWNCIVQRCTNLLKKFSSELDAISAKSQDQLCYGKLAARAPPIQRGKYRYHMRKLVPDVAPTLVAIPEAKEAPYSGSFIQNFFKQKKEAVVAYLFSKPLIGYIFGEQDDNKIRYALHNGQLVIWAAEAISSLSVFSLSEDSYGIVQKDMPSIINSLLLVKQALDKLQKSAVLARKMQADDKLIREIFTSLRSAIKRSLYRIVTNFEPYINDLSLELQTVEQLQGFLNYKE